MNKQRTHRPEPDAPIGNTKSMHAHVTDDVDCCSCEAEQRWQAVGEENARRRRRRTGPDAPDDDRDDA